VPMPVQRFHGRETEISVELLATRDAALGTLGTTEL
jgi:hypothetical protein